MDNDYPVMESYFNIDVARCGGLDSEIQTMDEFKSLFLLF